MTSNLHPLFLSTCSILLPIANALRGKWMWTWLFRSERVRVTAGIKKIKKCQRLIWYTSTRLSHGLTYNPTGVTLACSLLAKCRRSTWLLSYTVWYPQAALGDTAEVQRFKLTLSGHFRARCNMLHICLHKLRLRKWHRSAFPLRANLYSYDMWFIRSTGLNNTIPQHALHLYKWKKARTGNISIKYFPFNVVTFNAICMQ